MQDRELIEKLWMYVDVAERYGASYGEETMIGVMSLAAKRLEELCKTTSADAVNAKKEMTIRINTHGNPVPESHGEWVDLATAEDVELGFLDFQIISLGVSMQLPDGYYAHVVPRSSTFKKWGILLANSMGVIENDYCGDGDVWGFPALCLRKEGVKIPKGTRICQFRIVKKAPTVEFWAVEKLGNANRGGYGSTGEGVTNG